MTRPTEDTPTPQSPKTGAIPSQSDNSGAMQQLREAIEEVLDTYGGKYKPREYSDKLLALFQKEQLQLVSELEGELPKKKAYEEGDHEDANSERRFIKAAHNNAVDQVATLLEHKKQELEGTK